MNKKYITLGVLLTSFIIITFLVLTGTISFFDDSIYNFLISLRCDFLDFYFKSITILGNPISIVLIVVFLLFILKKDAKFLLLISALSSVLSNTLIKNIIRRERPSHLRLISETGFSFPSGHAMISICVYGMLIYIVNKNIKNKYLRVSLESILVIIIASIGLSRIYVGVHYPSDVLAGYILASSLLIIIIMSYNKLRGNLNGKTSS